MIIAEQSLLLGYFFIPFTKLFVCVPLFVDFWNIVHSIPAPFILLFMAIFLIARNRKRKNGKIEYKKIPIPKQAQGLIDWTKPLTADLHRLKLNDIMKELLAGKTAYCLRHTFATVCQQYIRPDIVDIWMGDSPTRLVGRVYTHFPDDFMLENMQKVVFPIA